MKFTHSDTSLHSKHCTLCRIVFTCIYCNIGTIRTNLTWTQNVECTNVERKINPHCNTHKPPYRPYKSWYCPTLSLLADVVVHSTDSSSWNRSVNRSVTLWSTITDVTAVMWSSWLRALVLVRQQGRAGVNWHQRFIDNCIQQCRNLVFWQPYVWRCCCCCCGDEKSLDPSMGV